MLYQKILMDDAPYQWSIGSFRAFEEHRHADIEFNYCVRGGFDIIIDKKRHHVSEGEMSLIGPMVSHEVPAAENADRLVLTAIVGPSLLKKHFSGFSGASFHSPICSLNSGSEAHRSLRALLQESAEL